MGYCGHGSSADEARQAAAERLLSRPRDMMNNSRSIRSGGFGETMVLPGPTGISQCNMQGDRSHLAPGELYDLALSSSIKIEKLLIDLLPLPTNHSRLGWWLRRAAQVQVVCYS